MRTWPVITALSIFAALIWCGCSKDDDESTPPPPGPSVSASEMSAPGVSLVYLMVEAAESDSLPINVGAPGANQTWVFPQFGSLTSIQRSYLWPADAPGHEMFPAATRVAEENPTEPSYWYQRISGNGVYELGVAGVTDTSVYTDERFKMKLPLVMGASWGDVERQVMSHLEGDSVYIQDSLVYAADGWGTIITHEDTVQCIRVFVQDWYLYHASPVNITHRYVAYRWYDLHGDLDVEAAAWEDVTDPNFHGGYVTRLLPARPTSLLDTPRRPTATLDAPLKPSLRWHPHP